MLLCFFILKLLKISGNSHLLFALFCKTVMLYTISFKTKLNQTLLFQLLEGITIKSLVVDVAGSWIVSRKSNKGIVDLL